MFHFLVLILILVFSFSLVSMLVWSRSRWTVRVGGGLAGVLRERVYRDKVWIGWVDGRMGGLFLVICSGGGDGDGMDNVSFY